MAYPLTPRRGGGGIFDPFSWDVWDPFDFGFFGGGGGGGGGRAGGERDDTRALAQTRVDWRETDDAHILFADIPGVRKEEVKVQVEDGNVLQISGERSRHEETEGDRWHRVETRRGSFVRRFRLPDDANVENISGSLDSGVLTVTVPKKEGVGARQGNVRSIDIQ